MDLMSNTMLNRLKARASAKILWQLKRQLPSLGSELMQWAHFWPHKSLDDSYAWPAYPVAERQEEQGHRLPIPPRSLWATYCTSPESYLISGQEDIAVMLRVLTQSGGAPVTEARRILELGAAAGRLLRHLADLPETELWGVDLWSDAMIWCQEHLNPPMHFATTTAAPHLPFADAYFGLVFAGSVFTHIDDLFDAWICELARVIRRGGRLYVTINDRHALKIFQGEAPPEDYPRYWERCAGKQHWDRFVRLLTEDPAFARFARGNAYMATAGRSVRAQVLWDADAFARRVSWAFTRLSVTPAAYGHQTGVLFARR